MEVSVYIPPPVPGMAAACDRHETLLKLANHSVSARLVASPTEADLIMIYLWEGEAMNLVNRFSDKCFVIDESDEVNPLLHGIFASGHKKLSYRARIRTGSYALYPAWFRNPFVEGHAGDAWLRPKQYLASFIGRLSHICRRRLVATRFKRDDININCTNDFNLFEIKPSSDFDLVRNKQQLQQKYFVDTLELSKFALCPRGSGASSIRLFEAMELGVAPVIQSDDWILPNGPDWTSFAIFLPEQASVERVLVENESQYRERGRLAREAWERFFSPRGIFRLSDSRDARHSANTSDSRRSILAKPTPS